LLLEKCPYLATMKNNNGELPLYIAIKYHTSVLNFIEILNAYPAAVFDEDFNPLKSINLSKLTKFASVAVGDVDFASHWNSSVDCTRECFLFLLILKVLSNAKRDEQSISFQWNVSNTSEYKQDIDIDNIVFSPVSSSIENWNLIKNFIDINSGAATEWRDLHICLKIKKFPLEVLNLMIDPSYEISQCTVKDENGNLPLHIACSSYPDNNDWIHYDEVISKLLMSFSGAARIKNGKGQLPLSIVLNMRQVWSKSVELLLHANPSAIMVRDSSSGLLPFMIVAVAAGFENDSCSKINIEKLNCIYQVLKFWPDACLA